MLVDRIVGGSGGTPITEEEAVEVEGTERDGNLNFLVNVRNGVRRREITGVDNSEVSAVEYCRRRERG